MNSRGVRAWAPWLLLQICILPLLGLEYRICGTLTNRSRAGIGAELWVILGYVTGSVFWILAAAAPYSRNWMRWRTINLVLALACPLLFASAVHFSILR
ncbi:hypothetical protein FHU30_004236 [Actinomadura rupiterrae]|nr:hypothetical protein [Actinomadura rupiterrae]